MGPGIASSSVLSLLVHDSPITSGGSISIPLPKRATAIGLRQRLYSGAILARSIHPFTTSNSLRVVYGSSAEMVKHIMGCNLVKSRVSPVLRSVFDSAKSTKYKCCRTGLWSRQFYMTAIIAAVSAKTRRQEPAGRRRRCAALSEDRKDLSGQLSLSLREGSTRTRQQ
jgi:hypothetical protein